MRCVMLSVMLLLAATMRGQERYFYSGKNYGSEALYNPVSLVLNGSFDIIQLEDHPRNFLNYPYGTGFTNLMNNLFDPLPVINRFGWGDFITQELLPINVTKAGGQWWPNYQLHLIGGGMTYTTMKEWYEIHNFPSPTLSSITTMAVYHLMNEIVENGSYVGDNEDPIADIYFFDIGGIVLFSSEGVNKFFSKELNLADWSLQPSVTFPGGTLQNNGQYFSVKWKFPFSERFHFFYYCGMDGLTGISYKNEDGSAYSFGAGLRAKHLRLLNPYTNEHTAELTWNFGLFYDRDNSLMASVLVSGLTDYPVSVNVYPGIIRFDTFSPGMWLIMNNNGKLIVGVSTVWTPGIGFQQQ